MACPVCGAKCVCKKRGEGGLCCGCHRHKSQQGYTRAMVDTWRAQHQLPPIGDAQWTRSYATHVHPLFKEEDADGTTSHPGRA